MELNQRHSDFQSLALPTELFGLHIYEFLIDRLNYVKKSMFKFLKFIIFFYGIIPLSILSASTILKPTTLS